MRADKQEARLLWPVLTGRPRARYPVEPRIRETDSFCFGGFELAEDAGPARNRHGRVADLLPHHASVAAEEVRLDSRKRGAPSVRAVPSPHHRADSPRSAAGAGLDEHERRSPDRDIFSRRSPRAPGRDVVEFAHVVPPRSMLRPRTDKRGPSGRGRRRSPPGPFRIPRSPEIRRTRPRNGILGPRPSLEQGSLRTEGFSRGHARGMALRRADALAAPEQA